MRGGQVFRFDLGTGEITDQTDGFDGERSPLRHGLPATLWDVHDDTEVWSWGDPGVFGTLGIRAPGTAPQALPEFESQAGQLSSRTIPFGRHDAAPVRIPEYDQPRSLTLPEAQNDNQFYPFVAWSYGNTALIILEGSLNALHACDAVQRVCKTLSFTDERILPAS